MRAHGPVRARQGELHGPPTTVARQVRTVTVRVEQLEGGRWRFTMPRAPGWAMAARTPVEAAGALRSAFTEAQVAAYSDWRGHTYDAAVPVHRRRRAKRSAPSPHRRDVHPPTAWRLAGDGRWVSPSGLLFPEDTQVVQRVMAKRQAMGLSARPDPAQPDAASAGGSG